MQPTGIVSTLAVTNKSGWTAFHLHTALNAVIMSFALPGGYAHVIHWQRDGLPKIHDSRRARRTFVLLDWIHAVTAHIPDLGQRQ